MHTTFERIELESLGWSGFQENWEIFKFWDNLARFVQNLYAYEPNLGISICIIFVLSTVSTAVFVHQ